MGYKCKAQQREYQRKWRVARRAKWLDGKRCVKCGSTENLNVDHIDPAKKVEHRIWSWSWKRILEELEKCQVLCAKCHVEKTAEVDGLRPVAKHGSDAMYDTRGCRCDECRAWKRTVNAQRKERGWI